MFWGKATPTYVFPVEVKEAVRERIEVNIQYFDDPQGPTIRTDFQVCTPHRINIIVCTLPISVAVGWGETIRDKINFCVVSFQTALCVSSHNFFCVKTII